MRKRDHTGYYVKRGATSLAVLGIVLCWTFAGSWSASGSTKENVRKWMQKMPAYRSHATYMDRLLDNHHSDAFNRSYTRASGKYGTARMDRNGYMRTLFNGMIREAAEDGNKEVADELRRHYGAYAWR